TSSGTTRYCRPPVLMTANIVLFLRVRSRPRTGPGRLFLQSVWIQFPPDRGAIPRSRAKISGARIPAPGAGTYSRGRARVKENWAENRSNVSNPGILTPDRLIPDRARCRAMQPLDSLAVVCTTSDRV